MRTLNLPGYAQALGCAMIGGGMAIGVGIAIGIIVGAAIGGGLLRAANKPES